MEEEKREPGVNYAFDWTGLEADPDWKGLPGRLKRFFTGAPPAPTPDDRQQIVFSKAKGARDIVIRGLTMVRPDQDIPTLEGSPRLIEDLDLTIRPGTRIAIIGKNGTGKSTLLRGLVGFWPFGKGEIIMPEGVTLLPLPQTPYVPALPFRSAVTFPEPDEKFTDEQIIEALKTVEHEELAKNMPKKADGFFNRHLVPYASELAKGYSYQTNQLTDSQLADFSRQLLDYMDNGMTKWISDWHVKSLHENLMGQVRDMRKATVPDPHVQLSKWNVKKLAQAVAGDWTARLEFPGEKHWLLKLPVALKNIFNLVTLRPVHTQAEIEERKSEVKRLNALVEFLRDKRDSDRVDGAKLQRTLSGGQKQRLRIAGVLLNRPEILIGDEITSSLDEETGHAVMKLLMETMPKETTMIFVVHDKSMLQYFDTVGEIRNGRLIVSSLEEYRQRKALETEPAPQIQP